MVEKLQKLATIHKYEKNLRVKIIFFKNLVQYQLHFVKMNRAVIKRKNTNKKLSHFDSKLL